VNFRYARPRWRCLGLALALLASAGSGRAPTEASRRPPRVVPLSAEDAALVLRSLGAPLPQELAAALETTAFAARWSEWRRRHEARIRARLQQGEEDSLIHFLLFGTSFTRHPRVTAKDVEALPREGGRHATEIVSRLLRGRMDDLLAGLAAPGRNERLLFLRQLVRRKGYDPDSAADRPRLRAYMVRTLARLFAEQQALARAAQEAERSRTPAEEFLRRSTLYRARGLSLDTSLWPNLALEEALSALHARGQIAARSLRTVAVLGPGLDFTDKQEGFDFYPLQTLQPFALIDTLRRLDLSDERALRVYALDLSERVIAHVARAHRRAQQGYGYTLQLPLDPDIPWTRAALSFWERFGTEIGTPAMPVNVPAELASLRVRAICVRPDVVRRIIPVKANIILERVELPASEAFDLIVATNVFVYYEIFEQSLAMKNIERMLRPGGFLLANNALPELPVTRVRSVGYSTTVYSERPKDGDHIVWYQRGPDPAGARR